MVGAQAARAERQARHIGALSISLEPEISDRQLEQTKRDIWES